jgi:hypothetical protein
MATNLGFLDQSCYISIKQPLNIPMRLVDPVHTHYFSENLVVQGIKPRTSESAARINSQLQLQRLTSVRRDGKTILNNENVKLMREAIVDYMQIHLWLPMPIYMKMCGGGVSQE